MKKLILMIMSVLVFSSAQAYSSTDVDTTGLSDKQKAELALKAAEMKEAAKQAPVSTTQQVVAVNDAAAEGVRKWGNVSTEIAKGLVTGLAAAAKEANVAVNDFAVTPVGRITTAIIVWKMVGKDLLAGGIGIFLLVVGCPVIWKVFRKLTTKTIEYEYEPMMWGLYKKRRVTKWIQYDGDAYGWFFFFFLIAEVGTFLTALSMIAR